MQVILAGNPNTGKTTLFNTLAKANEHASNWHGVTVDIKSRPFKIGKEEFILSDIPGLYSLDGYSEEEKIASKFIDENKDAIIVCILDANNLRRNLYLALELKKRSNHVLLAINMASEVKGLDEKKLEKELGLKCYKIDARKSRTLKKLKEGILEEKNNFSFEKQTRTEIREFDMARFEKKSREQFAKIDEILESAGYKTKGFYGFSKLDSLLLNPIIGFLFFALVMAVVFFITFGAVGSFFSDLVSGGVSFVFDKIISFIEGNLGGQVFVDFVREGIFGGVLTVFSFLPQIVLLFLSLNFLEDIGYLSRVALLFDGIFKKLGLTGRSAFSLIMGLGCSTTAVMTTRNLDNDNLKKKTAMLIPFMSCSAKLPIYAVICSAFFSRHKAIMVFFLYMLGILLMLLISLLMKARAKKQSETFMLELPKFRIPNAKKVILGALKSAGDFLVRVGGVLLIASIAVFLLYNFSFKLTYVKLTGDKSILESIAGVIKYIFYPLGFGSVGAVIAILSGLVAKEMVVSSLAIVNSANVLNLAESLQLSTSPVHFTSISAISFLVFILLYPPCISAFFSTRREVGTLVAIKSFFLQLATAYLTSGIIYLILYLASAGLWWVSILVVIALAITIILVLKYSKKKQSYNLETLKINCSCCKEKCEWK